MTKFCPKCERVLTMSAFGWRVRTAKTGRKIRFKYAYCKKCTSRYSVEAARKVWVRARNGDEDALRQVNDRKLRKSYGIGWVDYQRMLKEQDGLCAICKRPPVKIRLNVDHNHKTGKVRGLLCWSCNKALGAFRDSVQNLAAALEYVRKFDL